MAATTITSALGVVNSSEVVVNQEVERNVQRVVSGKMAEMNRTGWKVLAERVWSEGVQSLLIQKALPPHLEILKAGEETDSLVKARTFLLHDLAMAATYQGGELDFEALTQVRTRYWLVNEGRGEYLNRDEVIAKILEGEMEQIPFEEIPLYQVTARNLYRLRSFEKKVRNSLPRSLRVQMSELLTGSERLSMDGQLLFTNLELKKPRVVEGVAGAPVEEEAATPAAPSSPAQRVLRAVRGAVDRMEQAIDRRVDDARSAVVHAAVSVAGRLLGGKSEGR